MSACRCGAEIPESCGYHPPGEECMCFGTMCGRCLGVALGFARSVGSVGGYPNQEGSE